MITVLTLVSCATDDAIDVILMPMGSYDHKSHVAPHFNHIDLKKYNGAIDDTITSWDAHSIANSVTDQKGNVAPHFKHLELKMQWCNWRYHWHNMMPMLASVDDVTSSQGHIAHHFDCLYQMNGMVQLTMPLVSHNSDTNVIGVAWPTNSCHTLLQLSSPKGCNGTIDNIVDIMWHWYHRQIHAMTRKSHSITFQSSSPSEYSCVIYKVIGIIWCQHWYQCTT